MGREVAITDTGTLGVLYLKHYWRRRLDTLDSLGQQDIDPVWENLDCILLHGLGLGIVDPDRFIFQERPSFETFEHWIADNLGSTPDPAAVTRVNAAIRRCLEQPHHDYPMAAAIAEPALSAADMAFWHEHGYVIVRGAVPRPDARAAELAVWDYLGKDPEQPDTWYDGEHRFWAPLYRHPALERNRRSDRIRKAFAQIWGTEDLIATTDATSLNLPECGDGADRSGPSRLHWDTSLARPMAFGVLGILYLTDTAAEQGAFQCVPGFHHHLGEWLDGLAPGEDPRRAVLGLEAVPIAADAGDLIIWHQALPHGSSANRGSYPRVAQYISMFPPDFPTNPVWI